MPDHGHDVLFGIFPTPAADQRDQLVAMARRADELGLDLIGVQDHPYQPRFLETWTLLSTLAAETENIRLFPDVANLPLRSPAVLARAAATLDLLSDGRVELGLGAGAFWDAIEANGGPRLSARESVDALEEAIPIIRGLWAESGSVRVEGTHYRVRGAKAGPAPAHPIGIWIGAYGPRMLRLTGRLADGWVPSAAYLPVDQLGERSRVIDDAARAAGRDPAAIRRVYNVNGDFAAREGGFLQGPPRVWVEQLAELVLEHGISAFVLAVDPAAPADMRRFAEEVAPGVRDAVARERGQPLAEPLAGPPPPSPEDGAPPVLDEATRPRLLRREDAPVTADGAGGQQLLLQVHDHLRSELAQLREAIEQLEAGLRDPAWVRTVLARLTNRQNWCSVGAFCAGYCRLVAIHHTIEDRRLFPDLRGKEAELEPVLKRLELEHEVIAEALESLDDALGAMLSDPERIVDVRAALQHLAGLLLSHLTYEEEELLEPIGRLGITV